MKWSKTRKQPGQQNKTEQLFEATFLKPWLATGKIQSYGYERITFKLGPDCRYTPDFDVKAADDVTEFYECKGSFQLDANGKTKFKVASQQFDYRFYYCEYLGKAKGWKITSPYD